MEIIFHVGPHKTGTTSIQQAFLFQTLNNQRSEIKKDEVWYPIPSSDGPGHALLAWKFLGLHNYIVDSSLITKLLAEKRNDAAALLLSSEEFSKGYDNGWCQFSKSMNDLKFSTLVTLNSVADRTISMWQECLKHGHVFSLSESQEYILSYGGLKSDFCTSILRQTHAKSLALIITDIDQPNTRLFQNVNLALAMLVPNLKKSCINLPELVADDRRINKSFGVFECAALLMLNKHHLNKPYKNYMDLRDRFLNIFNLESWRKDFPFIEIPIPRGWVSILNDLAHKTIKRLEQTNDRLMLFGKLNSLTKSSRPIGDMESFLGDNTDRVRLLKKVVENLLKKK